MNAADVAVKNLIIDELHQNWPAFEQAEAAAAARLGDCVAALQQPLAAISAVDDEIAEAERKRADWEARMSDSDMDIRVEAHWRAHELIAERQRLTEAGRAGAGGGAAPCRTRQGAQ